VAFSYANNTAFSVFILPLCPQPCLQIAMPFASQSHIAQAAERSHVIETDWGLKALTAQ